MMRNSKWFMLMLVLVTSSCSLFGEEENKPEIPGKLVYSAPDGNGRYQIYTSLTNGTKRKQLTNFENDEAFSPSWSPDGKQIVFTSSLQSTSLGLVVHIMDDRGKNIRPMKLWPDSLHAYSGSNPVWSPDGTKIAFDWCVNCELFQRNTEIFMYDFETDSVIQITDNTAEDTHPTWNPDGSKIAFRSQRDYYNADTLRFRGDLYTLNIDGTGLTRLTDTGYVNSPTWVPNSDVILFGNSNFPYELREVNINTKQTNNIDLSFSENAIYYPLTVSPDYSKLLVYKYGLSSPHDNSISIWNLHEDSYTSIFSKSTPNANPYISGADWYYPKSN